MASMKRARQTDLQTIDSPICMRFTGPQSASFEFPPFPLVSSPLSLDLVGHRNRIGLINSKKMGRNNCKTGEKGGGENSVQDCEKRISDSLASLHKMVQEAQKRKLAADETFQAIEAQYEKIRSEKKTQAQLKSKLKSAYSLALKESDAAADKLREALAEITKIRKLKTEKRVMVRRGLGGEKGKAAPIRRGALMVLLQQSANTLPLWIGKLGQSPPPLCGAISEDSSNGHTFNSGDAVAALVPGEEDEDNWILAEIVQFHGGSGKFEIEDVDEEQKERYQVSRKKLIPLPVMRANPETDPEAIYPQDSLVLALYPQTTCFYKGVVEQVPSVATQDYLIAFEDSSYPNGFSPPLPVPQRYVLSHREGKTASK